MTGSTNNTIDVSRASALVAPRATRGPARDSHRGRSLRISHTTHARLRAAERERRNPLAFLGAASSRASRPSRISFLRQRLAGSCRALDAARREDSGYRVGSRARLRVCGSLNARRRRLDSASSGEARARDRESVPLAEEKFASAAPIRLGSRLRFRHDGGASPRRGRRGPLGQGRLGGNGGGTRAHQRRRRSRRLRASNLTRGARLEGENLVSVFSARRRLVNPRFAKTRKDGRFFQGRSSVTRGADD